MRGLDKGKSAECNAITVLCKVPAIEDSSSAYLSHFNVKVKVKEKEKEKEEKKEENGTERRLKNPTGLPNAACPI